MSQVVLFGAGGHAKVVLETLVRCGRDVVAVLDDDPAATSRRLLTCTIAGDRLLLRSLWSSLEVIPGIGKNAVRAELIQWLRKEKRELGSAVHPGSIVSGSAIVRQGSFVGPGTIVNADAVLEEGVILNTGASVDHDCRIGFCAHIAPGASLCGNVRVGARALVGAGSVVIPGIQIGADAVVGAGSVVVHDVPEGARWCGNPARPISDRGPR